MENSLLIVWYKFHSQLIIHAEIRFKSTSLYIENSGFGGWTEQVRRTIKTTTCFSKKRIFDRKSELVDASWFLVSRESSWLHLPLKNQLNIFQSNFILVLSCVKLELFGVKLGLMSRVVSGYKSCYVPSQENKSGSKWRCVQKGVAIIFTQVELGILHTDRGNEFSFHIQLIKHSLKIKLTKCNA